MIYEYLLTYQDYKDAQVLYRQHRRLAALSYYFWIWLLPIVVGLSAIPGLMSYAEMGPDWFYGSRGFVFPALWLSIFIPVMRVIGIRRCWKRLVPPNFSGSKMKAAIPVTIEFNDEQVISAIPGRSEGRFFWSAILDFAENDKLALIFVQKKNFIFVPKHALPDAAWAELRSIVHNKVKVS